MEKVKQCSQTIFGGRSTSHQCRRNGVVVEDRKPWCKQHAPSAVRAKTDAWRKRFDEKMAAGRRRIDADSAKAAFIEAATALAELRKWNSYVTHEVLVAFDDAFTLYKLALERTS